MWWGTASLDLSEWSKPLGISRGVRASSNPRKAKVAAVKHAWSPVRSAGKKTMFQLGTGSNSTPALPSPFPTLLTPANDMYYEKNKDLDAHKEVWGKEMWGHSAQKDASAKTSKAKEMWGKEMWGHSAQKDASAKTSKAKQQPPRLGSLGLGKGLPSQSNGQSPGKMRSAALLARGVDWISSKREKVFSNTNKVSTLTHKPQNSPPQPTGRLDRDQVSELRNSLNLPEEIMSEAHDLFLKHANPGSKGRNLLKNRRLTEAGFAKVWAEMTGQADEDEDDAPRVPAPILVEAFRHAGTSCELDFEQFALWFSSRCFSEDVSLDKESKKLRRIARKHDIHHSEVESYKHMFNKFDKDGNGTIDSTEFSELLCTCIKAPSSIGLPAARVENLWRQADENGDHEIDFEEFLSFYTKYLRTDSTGFEDFYRCGGLSRQTTGQVSTNG